jgi:hypothetical protein
LDIKVRKKLVTCYVWSIALYGVETWTLRKIDHNYLESFAVWCWRRMEKISWIDRVSNKILLQRAREEKNIQHTTKRRDDWIGHILC